LFEKVATAQMKTLGAGHPDILHTQSNLASAYAKRRVDDAIELLEKVRGPMAQKIGRGPSRNAQHVVQPRHCVPACGRLDEADRVTHPNPRRADEKSRSR